MSNIVQRTLTGALYISIVLVSLFLHPLFFGILTMVFNFISIREFSRMSFFPGLKNSTMPAVFNSLLLFISVIIINIKISHEYIVYVLILLGFVYFSKALFGKEGNPVLKLADVFSGLIYITIPLIFLNMVQHTAISTGIPFALALFMLIWTNDTFAYLCGITFGRHKMFERISPKKSWEGFLGGLIMTVAASFIFYKFFPQIGFVYWMIFAVLTTVTAVFGDFIESMFKRTAGVKDSGSILPGHGGMLDRIDSLLFAGPAIYIFINIILKLNL